MPSDRKPPKPVRAWAVCRSDGEIIVSKTGWPSVVRDREMAEYLVDEPGEFAAPVLITPETSDA